jgi:hypothetical protein
MRVSHEIGSPIFSFPIYCSMNGSFSSVTHDQEVRFKETPNEWLKGETDLRTLIPDRLLLETLFIR